MSPEFIRVVPGEVEEYGAAAAIVLAHIRYRCESDGPGRIDRDGLRWWRVSYDDLGRETGLTTKTIRGALKALGGMVLANHFPPLNDQSRAYRIAEDADPVTSQKTERADGDQPEDREGRSDAESGSSKCPEGQLGLPAGASALPIETLEKGGEEPGARRAPAPPPSSPQSANSEPQWWTHPVNGRPCCKRCSISGDERPCHDCGVANRAAKAEGKRSAADAKAAKAAITRAIDACPHCDNVGRLWEDSTDCPRHPNHRRTAA